jgi:hypothetical protein
MRSGDPGPMNTSGTGPECMVFMDPGQRPRRFRESEKNGRFPTTRFPGRSEAAIRDPVFRELKTTPTDVSPD